MPLIKCPMCNKEISPNAVSCPNCGEPMRKEESNNNFIKDSCNVVLLSVGSNPIKVIYNIRKITDCGLKEAKDTIDNTPSLIIKSIDYSKALEYKTLFEDLGAKIDIVSADEPNKAFNDYINNQNLGYTVKCSNCGSIDTKKISGASKVGSVVLFGIFSMGKLTKTYQCNKCGYRW